MGAGLNRARIAAGASVLRRLLSRAGCPRAGWTARILDRASAERTVVEYERRLTRGGARAAPSRAEPLRRVIGKFYADDAGSRTYTVMRALTRALRRGGDRRAAGGVLAVPRALGYAPRERLLFLELAPGVPYVRLAGARDAGRCFRAAGEALAALHALPIRLGRTRWLRDHIRELIRPDPLELAEAFPEYRSLIERALAALTEGDRRWRGRIVVSPLHRDFHLRQLFYEAGAGRSAPAVRVWVVDWDVYAKGDPTFDVAYFATYLRTHLGPRAERAVDAFFSGYCAHRPDPLPERLAAYEAFNYLRRACRRFRLRDASWEAEMRAMLSRCARSLS